MGFSLGCIYRLDAGMSVWAAQHFTVEQARQIYVGAVLGSPGDFIHTVGSNWTFANNIEFNLRQNNICLSWVGNHWVTPLSHVLFHFLRCVQHRPNDFIVAGAATQVARKPVPDSGFVNIGLGVQQTLGSDDEPWSADSALEGGLFQERLLQSVQSFGGGQAFDRGDFLALGFNTQNETGVYDAAIKYNRACAAVAVIAALFGSSHTYDVPKALQ